MMPFVFEVLYVLCIFFKIIFSAFLSFLTFIAFYAPESLVVSPAALLELFQLFILRSSEFVSVAVRFPVRLCV